MKWLFTLFLAFHYLLGLGQTKVVHVLVALCDNKNQGIVPVPAGIGNGQDPNNNLYWGCAFGVKTFFKKQEEWKLLALEKNPQSEIYERLIFKHRDSSVYLVADAYDGAQMKKAIVDFFDFCAGNRTVVFSNGNTKIKAGGNADLVAFVGHDGLMDFRMDSFPEKADSKKRSAVVLACSSKCFFKEGLQKAGAYPLVWTTNLMCPEAYTLDAILEGWVKNETKEQIRERAAQAYNLYQKCGLKGARGLLVTGY